MKKITPLLVVLLFLLLPALAHGASDRSIANKAIAARDASAGRFEKVKFSSAFMESLAQEGACVNGMLEGIKGSTEMTDDEKFAASFGAFVLWVVDFTVDGSQDKIAFVDKESARLRAISKSLMRRTSSSRGRQIARSLQGHSLEVSGMARFEGGVDFCQAKAAIEEAGGYTTANFEAAFDAQPGWTVAPNIESSMKRGEKMIERGVKAMQSLRPSLSANRIDTYDDLPSFAMALEGNRALAARAAGKVSLGDVSGKARRLLERLG